MTMDAWITKLDDFLRLSDRELLTHAGRISREQAKLKAETEYLHWQQQQDALPQPVDEHFHAALEQLQAFANALKPKKVKG